MTESVILTPFNVGNRRTVDNVGIRRGDYIECRKKARGFIISPVNQVFAGNGKGWACLVLNRERLRMVDGMAKWLKCEMCDKPSQVRLTREVKTARGTSRKRFFLCGEHYRRACEVMGVGLEV